jgi:murein DD-endopeptidase MepM/ murein hydrolase activator NlpD
VKGESDTFGKLRIKATTLLIILVALTFALLPDKLAAQAGAILSLPFARRSFITCGFGCYPGHTGTDYRATSGTQVVAARAGTVTHIDNAWQDDTHPLPGQPPSYGNHIIIDHGSGYVTLYAHLSQNSFQVAVNDSVSRGQYIARSDNTGTSTAAHLHFELRVNGNAVDPYLDAWVSGSPIPMGYRDQNGTVHGPFALDDAKIYGKWLILNGEPGAPVEDDWPDSCYIAGEAPMNTLQVQAFERGRIQYCGKGAATCVAYAKTYLPPVSIGYEGWTSSVTIRNNSLLAGVRLTFFDTAGHVADSRVYHTNLPQRAAWTFDAASLSTAGGEVLNPIDNFIGGGVVSADVDTAVLVRDQNGAELTEYNGLTAADGLGSLGWEKVGTTVYLPMVKHHRYGRTSRIEITNAGVADTYADVQFYDVVGGGPIGPVARYFLVPNASTLLIHPERCTSATSRCSARIVSSSAQPLAVTVREQDDATSNYRATYTAFSSGATQNFVPLLKKNRSGMTTGLAIMNVGTGPNPTTVDVDCYATDGTFYDNCGAPTSLDTNATVVYASLGVDNNFLGSAVVNSTSQPVVTLIYETGNPYQLITDAPLGGTATAYVPELYGNYSLGGRIWDSGISIQNVGTSNANVTVTYYNQDGSRNSAQTQSGLLLYSTWILNRWTGNLPNGFAGSAVITSTQPIAAIVNTLHSGSGTTDTNASYTVPNR